ncbi:pyridoxal phosphate-dependent aminotransferase [Pseudoroseicyclus tamaricis]|uniref:Aminotransferase n=1 Tax=Pseudoroseicyclus tamaricis TaxID=2705421 RepID=A0A6B2JP22_9RHOB|nr:aminotransferase class I/II-fold pyridoxal phosphate-dependent enzyme [Pseudoroseicyclus tamaricis]NDV00447.1 aminotransferase class I/II-fold pyridoxal phosphate-dependent enzyme [Pseudoroseicyclus tamaricis]
MQVSRRGAVDPFIVMDVMEQARAAEDAGRHIIHMEVGQPGTGAPSGALARLGEEMAGDPLGYSVALGIPALRARIARHYGEWYGVDLDPARVIVTAGASGAFLLSFTALFDAGARVGLGLPCYPSYRQILRALSLEPVHIRTRLQNGMQPVPAELEGLGLNGLLLASPNNPTGAMLDRDRLAEMAAACEARGIALISDEIYHGIGNAPVSALEVTDEVHVINSFSKYFSMTGWRVGWMVVPPDHVRLVERLAQNMFICPSHAAQRLALHAFDCPEELEANAAVYEANRAMMVEVLAAMGLGRIAPPDGAFYIYADVSAFTGDSLAFAGEILAEAGVAVTPGLDFDPEEGHRWMRFSYARATADIEEGLARLSAFFARRAAA